MERVTGIEPAWSAWKASGTRSRLSVKIGADLRISVFDLDRCGPCWALFYRPYGPATAPLDGFPPETPLDPQSLPRASSPRGAFWFACERRQASRRSRLQIERSTRYGES